MTSRITESPTEKGRPAQVTATALELKVTLLALKPLAPRIDEGSMNTLVMGAAPANDTKGPFSM